MRDRPGSRMDDTYPTALARVQRWIDALRDRSEVDHEDLPVRVNIEPDGRLPQHGNHYNAYHSRLPISASKHPSRWKRYASKVSIVMQLRLLSIAGIKTACVQSASN